MNKGPEHVLILAPTGRDAALAEQVLGRAGLRARRCRDAVDLRDGIRNGAGAALIAEEGLGSGGSEVLRKTLGQQERWSDLPVFVLTTGRPTSPPELAALRSLETRHSLTFLERPVRIMTLVSALRAALENRRRQYEIRDLLASLARGIEQRDLFLAFLGHELRNPLGTIRNWIEVLRVGGHSPDRVRTANAALDRQVQHMTRLVDDLLDLARIHDGTPNVQKKPIELRSIVEQALEMTNAQIEARRHRLTVDLAGGVWVEGDQVRLVQVLNNLLGNAARYTDPGGEIHLELTATDSTATIRVRDNGRGLTADVLPRIFDLFMRGDRTGDGLGIGLTLSRRVAELHGGTLSAHSEGKDRGSEFVLELPTVPAPLLADPPATPAPAAADRALRILLVEDQADQGEALRLSLEQGGHEVRLAPDGRTALAIAAGWSPDVALLDIDLPDMDGCELARRLRQDGLQAPLVALSGFGLERDRERTRSAGCATHLTKPVTPAQLAEVFDRLAAG